METTAPMVPETVPIEETTAPTVPELVTEPTQAETTPETIEATEAPETVPEVTEEVYEYIPESQVEETTGVVMIDYTPIIAEQTSIVVNVILCGALMVVGVLCGIRLWR